MPARKHANRQEPPARKLIIWDQATEWPALLDKAAQLRAKDPELSYPSAVNKAQHSVLKSDRRRSLESIYMSFGTKPQAAGNQALAAWHANHPDGKPVSRAPAPSLVAAAPPGPAPSKRTPRGPRPEPVNLLEGLSEVTRERAAPTVTNDGRILWMRTERQMLAIGAEFLQTSGDTRSLPMIYEHIQTLLLPPDRRRDTISRGGNAAKLPALHAEALKESWQLPATTRDFVLRAVSGQTTGESEAAAAHALATAQATPAPKPGPIDQGVPIGGGQPHTMNPEPANAPQAEPQPAPTREREPHMHAHKFGSEELAQTFAAIMVETTNRLITAYNSHMEAVVERLVSERLDGAVAAMTNSIAATMREVVGGGLRSTVVGIMNDALGGASTPAPLAAPVAEAPTPYTAPAEAPTGPPAASTGPTFTLGDEVTHDPVAEAMAQRAAAIGRRAEHEHEHGPRIRVDIVGPEGSNLAVLRSKMNGTFDARFLSAREATHTDWQPRERVILALRFMNDAPGSDRIYVHAKDAGARIYRASGGLGSVFQQLEVMKTEQQGQPA